MTEDDRKTVLEAAEFVETEAKYDEEMSGEAIALRDLATRLRAVAERMGSPLPMTDQELALAEHAYSGEPGLIK